MLTLNLSLTVPTVTLETISLVHAQSFLKLDIDKWIREKERCSKCGRIHKMDTCTLKRPCNIFKEIHLSILHVNATKSATVMLTCSPSELLYIDKPNRSYKVMLKVVNVCIHNGEQTLKRMQSLMMVQIDLSCSPKLSSS